MEKCQKYEQILLCPGQGVYSLIIPMEVIFKSTKLEITRQFENRSKWTLLLYATLLSLITIAECRSLENIRRKRTYL